MPVSVTHTPNPVTANSALPVVAYVVNGRGETVGVSFTVTVLSIGPNDTVIVQTEIQTGEGEEDQDGNEERVRPLREAMGPQ